MTSFQLHLQVGLVLILIYHASYLKAYRVYIKGGRDFSTLTTRSSGLLTRLCTYSFKPGIILNQGLVPFLENYHRLCGVSGAINLNQAESFSQTKDDGSLHLITFLYCDPF